MAFKLKKKIKFKHRLRWNQAIRSPLPPALMGLVTFSFVAVTLGAAVYVAAVPRLVQQSPVVQTAANAIEESGLPEAVSGAFSNGGGFSEASVVSTNSSGFSSINTGSSNFTSIDSEKSNEADSDNSSEDSDSSESSESSKPSDSTNDENSGAADNEGQEPEEPTGPSDEVEAQYHAALVESYNALPSYEQSLSVIIQEFNEQCLNPSSDERYAAFQRAASVTYDLSLESSNLSRLEIPRDSQWYEASQALLALYSDLYGSAGIIQRCWLLNYPLDDPAPYEDKWMQPLTEHLVDGQIDLLIDYQQQKPSVGAML